MQSPGKAAVVLLSLAALVMSAGAQSKGVDPSLLARVKAGDPDAEFQIAIRLMTGAGLPQDIDGGLVELRKSADKGNAQAQYLLGQIYDEGYVSKAVPGPDGSYADGHEVHLRAIPKDFELAAKWYRLSAEQGYPASQNQLGSMYMDGRGVPQDYAEAYFWLSLAGAQGIHSRTNDVDDRDLAASHLTKTVLLETQQRARKWFAAHPPKAR